MAKVAGVAILSSIVVAAIIWKHIRPTLGLCVGYILFNTIWTGMGKPQTFLMMCVATSVLAAIPFVRSSESLKLTGLKALALAGLGESIWGILQHFKLDPIFVYFEDHDKYIPIGSMGQQTLLGPFIVCSLLACLYLRKWYLIAVPFILYTLFYVDSSFTYLSLLVGVTYLFKEHIKAKHVALLLAACGLVYLLGGIFGIEYFANLLRSNGRGLLYAESIDMFYRYGFSDRIFGMGGGSFQVLFPQVESKALSNLSGVFVQAHNDYLQVLLEFGFIGAALLVLLISDIAVSLYRTRSGVSLVYGAILVALMSNSLGNFIMRLQPHGLMALIAFIVIAENNNSQVYWKNRRT